MDKLTERETLVLGLILDGHDYGEIGEIIFKSPRTVQGIGQDIRNKLELKTRKRSEFFKAGRTYLKLLNI